jgi:hypothetical protein
MGSRAMDGPGSREHAPRVVVGQAVGNPERY